MPKAPPRPRALPACSVCRRRKVKCDKTHPICSVCAEHGIGHLCKYWEPEWAQTTIKAHPDKRQHSSCGDEPNNLSQVMALEKRVEELERELRARKDNQHERDVVCNFKPLQLKFDPESQSLTSPGGMCSLGMAYSDPFYLEAKAFLHDRQQLGYDGVFARIFSMQPGSGDRTDGSRLGRTEESFKKRLYDCIKAQSEMVFPLAVAYRKSSLSYISDSKTSGRRGSGSGGDSQSGDISDVLNKILPDKKTLFLLLDRFFKYVHPFYPYVDQGQFTKAVKEMLKRDKLQWNSKSHKDFATLSLLLVMLYLGSLTLKTCQNQPIANEENDPDIRYLHDHPLHKDTVMVSRVWANILMTFSRPMYDLLPFYMYMKVKQQCAPERVDPSMSHPLSDLILHLLVSLGLNRDPGDRSSRDPRLVNLLRKIWYGNASDNFFEQYQTEGTMVRAVDSDTELPFYQDGKNSNNLDPEVEKASIHNIRIGAEFQEVYDKINFDVTSTKAVLRLGEVLDLKDQLEELIRTQLPPTDKLLDNPDEETQGAAIKRVAEFKRLVEAKCMLVSIYFHLFLSHEQQGDPTDGRAFLYARETVSIASELWQLTTSMIPAIDKHFPSGFEVIIAPLLLETLCRLRPVETMITLRNLHASFIKQRHCSITPQTEAILDEMRHHISQSVQNTSHTYTSVTHYYFLAWRLSRTESYRIRCNDYLDKYWFDPGQSKIPEKMPQRNSMIYWSDAQLQEICDLLKTKRVPVSTVHLNGDSLDPGLVEQSETSDLNPEWFAHVFDERLFTDDAESVYSDIDGLLTSLLDDGL